MRSQPCRKGTRGAGRRRTDPTAGAGTEKDVAVCWRSWHYAADGPVHPVCDGTKGIVVERGHGPRVDGAVRSQRVNVPPLSSPLGSQRRATTGIPSEGGDCKPTRSVLP